MLDLLGSRPADQMVARVIRITLGGASYELPVRSIRANREWKDQLNAQTASMVNALDESDDLPAVLALLSGQADELLGMLLAYDTAGVLPDRDAIESIEPDPSLEILSAVREVWKAANPLVGIALEAVAATVPTPTEPSSPPTNTRRVAMAGRRRRSKAS